MHPEDGCGIDYEIRNPIGRSQVLGVSMRTRATLAVSVYDVAGRNVRHVFNGEMPSGIHSIPLGPPFPAGVYVVIVSVEGRSQFRATIVAR